MKFYCLSCGKDTRAGQTEGLRMLVNRVWRFVGLCLKCKRGTA